MTNLLERVGLEGRGGAFHAYTPFVIGPSSSPSIPPATRSSTPAAGGAWSRASPARVRRPAFALASGQIHA